MRTLVFSRANESVDGRHVRRGHFEARSTLPVPAACVVANGVRETLASLFGCAVDLRLFEPVMPSFRAWRAIAAGAQVYRISGAQSDAAVVLRADACSALVAAAFGEQSAAARALSPVESTVLDRIVRAVATNFAAVCGPRSEQLVPERVAAIDGFATYFELQIEKPVTARIGIALARDPKPEARGGLQIADISEVEIELRVRTEGVPVQAAELAAIQCGSIVPITLSSGLAAIAEIAGRPFARGEAGVRGNRLALAIGLSPCTERGSEPEP